MKKLQLNLSNVNGQVLTRSQLKNVLGGTGTCAVTWTAAGMTQYLDSADHVVISTHPNGTQTWTAYGVSKPTAQNINSHAGAGSNWCCDSCSSAGWYNPPTTTLPGEEPPVV